VISDFYHEVDKNRVLLGYYTASGGNSLPTCQDNLSVSSSKFLQGSRSQSLVDGSNRLCQNVS